MTKYSYKTNDVKVINLSIQTHKGDGGIFDMSQLLTIDIYEDVTKPTMYATIEVVDALDLLTKLPIIGEEKVELTIETPGITEPSTFIFRCFQVTNVEPFRNSKGITYTLHCVSEEHLNNTSTIRSHMSGLISDMVQRILVNSLSTKKKFYQEPTVGNELLNFPKLKPLAAIDFLRQRAVGAEHKMSPYVFFENQYGFNFTTIKGLFERGLKEVESTGRDFTFKQNPMGSPQKEVESFRAILDYQLVYNGESYRKLQQGAYRMKTQMFDLATKNIETIDFNLEEMFSSFAPDKKKARPNSGEWMNEFAQNVPQILFGVKDTSRPPIFVLENLAGKNSFSLLLNDDVTRVMVPGDSGLAVGHVVRLNMPEIDGLSAQKKLDKVRTGDYLIVRLRHMITFQNASKHRIVFDCVQLGS